MLHRSSLHYVSIVLLTLGLLGCTQQSASKGQKGGADQQDGGRGLRGGGAGQTVGFIEGREAASPFDEPTPIDAINAALVDEIFFVPLP